MKKAILGLLLCLLAPQGAQADMMLSPLRQVITAQAPNAVFSISNSSDRMLEGRVSWIDLTATETGYAPASIDARPALSAAPYLVVSPAQFRLEPGSHVEINVSLKDGAVIPQGERRSHLLVETAAARTRIRKAGNNSGLQVDIGLGVSAPVMLRSGDGSVEAKIGETKLVRDKNGLLSLETSIIPGGVRSSYGRIAVFFEADNGGGEKRLLGIRENVAGFLDAPSRKVETPLGFGSLEAGELTVRYEGAAEYDGRVFDTRSFDVAPPD